MCSCESRNYHLPHEKYKNNNGNRSTNPACQISTPQTCNGEKKSNAQPNEKQDDPIQPQRLKVNVVRTQYADDERKSSKHPNDRNQT